jgi:tRNA-dihydrouridine synthase 1
MADWEKIRAIKESIQIPVFVNGDLWHAEDVRLCRRVTGADGYMSAQGLKSRIIYNAQFATSCVFMKARLYLIRVFSCVYVCDYVCMSL